MNKHSLIKCSVVTGATWLAACLTLGAADFDLRVAASPDPVVLNRELAFTIDVTNRAGVLVTNAVVTNVFPASAQVVSASNSFGGIFTNAGMLRFGLNSLTNQQPARVFFSLRPTLVGDLTNTTSVGALFFTNTTANVVARVVSGFADLAAGMSGPPAGALANDWISYRVGATNRGPDAVPSVTLTNTLPAGVKLMGVNPTNPAISFANGELRFSLGTLASNGTAGFQVTIQPTNAGNVTLRAQIGAAGAYDPNTSNNFATNAFTVGSFGAGRLAAAIISTQQYNPQTGLMEQQVALSNTGATAVASARVLVHGLTNRLFNAVGTNNGAPFVVYATNLAAGASVELLLEYFVPARVAVPDPTLVAVEVPAFNPPLPPGTPVPISRLLVLPSGRVMIEFPAEPDRRYTVLYCGDATFSNRTRVALPPITAPADRVQWLDYGPPQTVSHPARTASRFYRVIAHP